MNYLLDGYNILFRERDSDGSLEAQRQRLFEKLSVVAAASHLNFIVVFDSYRQACKLERHHFHSIEVVYTDFEQTADDYILEYVECLSRDNRQHTKVVTSDKTLAQKVCYERVEVLSVYSFFKEIERKTYQRMKKKKEPYPSKSSSRTTKDYYSDNNDITSWITLFEIKAKQMDDSNSL